MVHATGHHPFEGIMSFRDKSKLSTAQHVKNRTSNKTNNQKCKIQSDFPFPILLLFCQTGRQKTAKKATCLSDSYLFPRLDLVQGGFWEANPPPLSFQRISVRVLQSTTILHENRREFFRGVFLSCLLFLFSWEKRNPNEPELLPLEGLRDDSGLVLLPLQGGLAGDTWVPQCDGGRYPGEK